MAEYRLRVVDVVVETHDSKSLVFETPDDPAFRYQPGQFLTLRIGTAARCYSLCSSPHTDDLMAVTVKRTNGGYASNWINDNVVPGMEMDVLPPSGVFTPASLDEDLLLCAGGSGVTPVMSIVKSVLAAGTGRVALVYANRDERSVIFNAALNELVAAYPDRLTVEHWLESERGLPNQAALRPLLAPYADREAFLCGPTAFMDLVSTTLGELGAPRVRVEKFLSLAKNPFGDRDPVEEAADKAAILVAEWNGERRTLSWPVNQTLLTVLREAGVSAPFSCEEGLCGACVCKKQDGDVTMATVEALEPYEIEEGYILACQAKPTSDKVVVTYE